MLKALKQYLIFLYFHLSTQCYSNFCSILLYQIWQDDGCDETTTAKELFQHEVAISNSMFKCNQVMAGHTLLPWMFQYQIYSIWRFTWPPPPLFDRRSKHSSRPVIICHFFSLWPFNLSKDVAFLFLEKLGKFGPPAMASCTGCNYTSKCLNI